MRRFAVVCFALFTLAGFFVHARADDDSWSTVKGRIVWDGANVPKQKPLADIMKSADKNHCLAKGDILDEEWVVNPKNKGIRWTFVWLADKGYPKVKTAPPIHPDLKEIKVKDVVMDQPMCKFVPHALGMREGQVLVSKNSSPIAHNYKWQGSIAKGIAGNVLIPPNGKFEIKGLVADIRPVLINCNIHTWMKGYVRVFDHPYFAVTDENGAFEMPKAPAGNYRLFIWHGSGGWSGGAEGKNGQPITIKAGAPTNLGELKYKLSES
ncbi:MAG: hypothetical protein FJ271_17225 [Planctomycetes bacterium]|nr:hypothetical protein [Planctomycetota bacterium]